MNDEQKDNSGGPKPREYADRDINLKSLWMFFLVSAVSLAAVFGVLRAIQSGLALRDLENSEKLPDFAAARQLPPADMPRLQAHPLQDLAAQHAYEDALINGAVAWADTNKSKARIPVTNAMQILISKEGAFPARTAK